MASTPVLWILKYKANRRVLVEENGNGGQNLKQYREKVGIARACLTKLGITHHLQYVAGDCLCKAVNLE